jgi:hypothetical protein
LPWRSHAAIVDIQEPETQMPRLTTLFTLDLWMPFSAILAPLVMIDASDQVFAARRALPLENRY